jgi:hypothetical protein
MNLRKINQENEKACLRTMVICKNNTLVATEVPYSVSIIEKFAKRKAKIMHFLLESIVCVCHSTVQVKNRGMGTEFSGRGECVNDIFVEWIRKMRQKIVDGANMSYRCLHHEAKHGYHRQPPCHRNKSR